MKLLLSRALLVSVLALTSQQIQAVHLSQNGLGEVLIYPYYTVNNDLNTLYTVVNTTAQPKALSIRFLEGDINLEVLAFHVYLDAFDVWTGALVPTTSTIGGHVGEPSVLHLTADRSCAPFLIGNGQEFLPFIIDQDLDLDNRNMRRATEGHIEVLDLGVLSGEAAAAIQLTSTGVPADCDKITQEWGDDATWELEPLEPSGGDLKGSAVLINVSEGMAFPYQALALKDFWEGDVNFTEPGTLEPNLNDASRESTVILDDGSVAMATWDHGFQAVSEVLTQVAVINEYVLDVFVAGHTDWVLTFPTKRFHVYSESAETTAPFAAIWDGRQACSAVELQMWDREIQFTDANSGCKAPGNELNTSPCPPTPQYPNICKATNVLEFILPGGSFQAESLVLGSDNLLAVNTPFTALTENGWAILTFPEAEENVPVSGAPLSGLPVTGFAAFQYTNAAAAPGLLAQYGGLFIHSGRIQLLEQAKD